MHYENIEYPEIMETDVNIPESFFTQIMPAIHDVIELKVILYIFHCLSKKSTNPAFVTQNELLSSLSTFLLITKEDFSKALKSAVNDRVFLHSIMRLRDKQQDIYFANIETNKEITEKIKRGEFKLKDISDISKEKQIPHQSLNIFVLYEQNIGMITPILSDELKAATELYPEPWIEEAFKEAVLLNKRNWRYIARILERWAREGKSIGADRQGNKKDNTNKYIRGKYGHLVKR